MPAGKQVGQKRDKKTGRLLPVHSESKRLEVVDAAKQMIMQGYTLAQIAHRYSVPTRTLDLWLHQLGDEYADLRQAWLDNMLLDAGDAIEQASDIAAASRARELWKRATWYAERRDPLRYGQINAAPTQQIIINMSPVREPVAIQDASRIDEE